MPVIIETTVYAFDELSEEARESARQWYRTGAFDYDWYDAVFDDFAHIAAILGVELRTRPIRLFGGGTRPQNCIYFSGFSSQGDGACFEGDWRHAKRVRAAIRDYAPRDAELHRIADALEAIQWRNFYQLYAAIRHRGRYYHEYGMEISVERDSPNYQEPTANAAEEATEALRDLARWLYRRLEAEFDYLNSDEAVDDAIIANDYSFTADGQRFG